MGLDLSTYGTVEVSIIAVLGLLLMFLGYRVKKVAFFVIWFVVGYYLTASLLPYVHHVLPDAVMEWPMYQSLIPLAGGLLLALLGFSIEKVCVAGATFAIVMLITVQYFGSQIQTMAIGGIVGVVLAGVAIMCIKPATILATSVAGAYALTIALLVLVPSLDEKALYFPSLTMFSIIGAVTQFVTTRRIT